MIKGIGIDLVELSRFSKISEDFLTQVFNTEEIESIKNSPLSSGIKFALKESILKALGKGLYFGSFWHNIILKNNKATVKGVLRDNLSDRDHIHTANCHSKQYACAIAIIEDSINWSPS